MNNTSEQEELIKEMYNQEPVFYCKNCLSLRVIAIPGIDDSEFCDECNATDIDVCDIETWRNMYKERYGRDYLSKDKKKH